MADNVRSDYPPKPSNPQASQGVVGNVGGGADPAIIRPTYPAKPGNPAASQGAVANVTGPKGDQPVVRGGE